MARIQHSDCGPAQALERAASGCSYELRQRGNSVTVRWAPAHAGVEGNERTDALAKRAAEGEEDRAILDYLREASLSHLTRKTTEARSRTTAEWIRGHIRKERRYRPRREEGSASGWARLERSWRVGFTSSCPATQQRRPTLSEWARLRTSAGVVAANDSRATTFSSSADAGRQRSNECGGESRRTASGSPPGPPQSAFSSATSKQLPPYWSSWRTPGWDECQAWPSYGGMESESELEVIVLWLVEGEGSGEESGPGLP